MSTREQAAELVEKTLNEVASVRARVGRAVGTAEEVDRFLWDVEKAIAGIQPREPSDPSPSVAGAPERPLTADSIGVQSNADTINLALRDARSGVEKMREDFAAGSAALTRAKSYLGELESLPEDNSGPQPDEQSGPTAAQAPEASVAAGQPVTTATLRDRLANLETAIAAADAGAATAEQRLGAARRTIGPLLHVPGDNRMSPRRVEALVGKLGPALKEDFAGLQAGVGTAYAARVQADRSTTEASELANALRAASNPTPRSARTTAATPSETPRRDGPTPGDQGRAL